jgi:hypothetical protein
MFSHERYMELGALAAIGQVSAEEDRELNEHLRDCSECLQAYGDYSRILRQGLPLANPSRFRMKASFVHPSSDEELHDRFFARARAQGVALSPEIEGASERTRSEAFLNRFSPRAFNAISWPTVLSAAAALCLLVAAFVFARYELNSRNEMQARVQSLGHQNDALRAQIADLGKQLSEASQAVGQNEAKAKNDTDLQARLLAMQSELNNARSRADAVSNQLRQVNARDAALASSSQKNQMTIADLRAQLDKLQAANTSLLASLVESQDKVREAKLSLERETEKLEMEHQLVSVSSDVRELMGARSLHILDVHDVNGTGKSAKSFGRVFYSEGQSLIFYAFDLPSGKLTPAKYHFQAWGQREGSRPSIHNLGTFAIDDHEQRRWVLKVKNPNLLHGLDSVFVTAESTADTPIPHGQRLLYAYFDVQPNHP